MNLIDLALSLLIPALIVLYQFIAPYTKVEESFNIQATHDVLIYGTPTSNVYEKLSSTYDHFTFPGAVPRTFVGPVILAGISQPVIAVVGFEHAQQIVRTVLGLFNAFALLVMKHNVQRAFGRPTARWYALLQSSQFHIIYYASRTLPNMFAFGLTTLAFAHLLPHPNPRAVLPRQRLAISLLVFAAVIFRSEIALLLATTSLHLLSVPLISLQRLLPPFAISFLMALLVSVPLDSYLWQRPLWPELAAFHYNAVLGSSSAWGTSPWHHYLTSALPRLLLNPLIPLLLLPAALAHPATSRPARNLLLPPLLFVAIYSLQPHKEARFVFYAVPPLTVAAAQGANAIFARRSKSAARRLAALALVASVAASFAAAAAMAGLSALNYPGGDALAQLRRTVVAATQRDGGAADGRPLTQGPVRVHADVLACMTGVTLFGTSSFSSASAGGGGAPGLLLDKTEDPARLADPAFWTAFDYLLVEDVGAVRGGDWDVVGVVEGYAGVEVLRPGVAAAAAAETRAEEAGKVVGKGAVVAAVRERVRAATGGWWVGPRMVPRIRILRRRVGGGQTVQA